jgi:signal transduction histidine kinase
MTSSDTVPGRALRDLLRTVWGPDPATAPRPRRLGRWYSPLLVPVGLLALAGLAAITGQYLMDSRNLPAIFAWPLALLTVAPLPLLRSRPLWAWRVTAVGLILGVIDARNWEAWPWGPSQILVALLVLFWVALREPLGVIIWSMALTCLLVSALGPVESGASATLLIVALVVLGEQIQRRRRAQAELLVQEERSELAEARRALLEERARIARELHDVVAHSMSLLAVRAETAPYRLPELPDAAREEFLAVAATARQTLAELRRMLGVLRTSQGDPELAPQPALTDLPDLIDAARTAGMRIDADLDLGEVPAATGLAAYRIVQEALSNAARHAAGARVRVAVTVHPDHVHAVVRNEPAPKPAARPHGTGHGLLGMRERALVLSGTLSAKPSPDGGFEVTADLPVAAVTTAQEAG